MRLLTSKELCDDTLVLCKLRASDNGITMQDNSLPYATGPYMIGSPTISDRS